MNFAKLHKNFLLEKRIIVLCQAISLFYFVSCKPKYWRVTFKYYFIESNRCTLPRAYDFWPKATCQRAYHQTAARRGPCDSTDLSFTKRGLVAGKDRFRINL